MQWRTSQNNLGNTKLTQNRSRLTYHPFTILSVHLCLHLSNIIQQTPQYIWFSYQSGALEVRVSHKDTVIGGETEREWVIGGITVLLYCWPQQDFSNLGIDLGHGVDWSGLFLFQSLYVLATVTIRNIWRKLRGKYWRVKDQQDTWEQTVLISVSVPQDSIVMSSSLFPLFLLLSPVFLPPVLSSPLQLVGCQCSSAATARVGVGSCHWSGVWHTLCTHWLGSQSETLLAFRLFFMV